MIRERTPVLIAFAMVAVAGTRCATVEPGNGDETHFQHCKVDVDCDDAGLSVRCEQGECRPYRNDAGADARNSCSLRFDPTSGASLLVDGGSCTLAASNYDQSCAVDADCVWVGEGNACTLPCTVVCPNTAINASALPLYRADYGKTPLAECPDFFCGCPAFRVPRCSRGKCELTPLLLPAADGGKDSGNFQGAPCQECDLGTQIPSLADAASEDCGKILLDAGIAGGGECARVAFEAGRSFTLIVDQAGTDSFIATAWVFAGGRLYRVSYDSNVCGGGATCDQAGCGPSISATTCVDPVASKVTGTVFECADFVDFRTVCGPAS